ncbi:nitrate/nitrite transporter NrtS [Microcystis sp. M53602_WE12]|uniref:nitrate/nitrite transporter NrtS n=1 Tax=Microcystis sp. M53602_WE12 TaxID=3030674 RepID=UPI002582923A|nr:nitrate/nitrite transporter NrtS [Microcystis sp. M53602_WE12]MDJ0606099.1 nitrate/nitrite transporter NrtS [Microcystis sp. M53602_WE12]
MKGSIGYFRPLLSPQFAPTGIRVAVVVGTILLTINHGYAVIIGRMTGDRWLAALLTYLVPYLVNVHGQYSSYHRQQWPKKSPK